MAKPTIFISYSHKDEEWKNRLITHLGVLQQQDYLDVWVDTRIEGGADWFQEIEEAIEATSIAVLLISADFLNSKFITENEVPLLLQQQQQKGLRIYSIILKPCDWHSVPWLKKFMARPKDGKPISTGNENQIETDLAAIAKEIRELLQRAGLPGEKREYVPLPPDQVSLSKLPTTQHALFGREKELKKLDDAWENPHCHVLCFVAFGGVGKAALVNEWLNQMGMDNYRGAERVYGWSFYSQGTSEDKQASADTCFEEALTFFDYTGEPITSPWDIGVMLAKLIRGHKTLLILDGLEPLQYPPGEMEGRLRDQGLQALLKELARFNNGLAVITTRCKVTDIEHTMGKTAQCVELENLSPEAGRQLLREAGVINGTNQELQTAAREYGCHALALTLLGRYLAVRYGGEIRQRDTIKKLAYEGTRQGVHARHVMDSYDIWLNGTPELELLYIMGLFDRTAPIGAIKALKQPPEIKGVTVSLQGLSDEDWDFAVERMRDLRLLTASEADKLDCHPLIREHFSQELKAKSQQAWKDAHERLYVYYKNLPKKELPDTLEEMEPLFAAVAHGCQARKYQEVFYDVYWKRISRSGDYFTFSKLGAFGSDLAALHNFFEKPWSRPNEVLVDSVKAVTLSIAGFGLRALGRLREATQPMQAGLESVISQKDWKQAAMSSARESVDFANRNGNTFQRKVMRSTLANSLHQIGELIEASNLFVEAEKLQICDQPEYKFMYSTPGFQFCDLLLSQGKVREVLARTKQTLEWVTNNPNSPILTVVLDYLSLGRAYLLEAVADCPPRGRIKGGVALPNSETSPSIPLQRGKLFQQAADYLNQAVAGLREAGQQHHLPRGLFARAFCYRIQNQFPQAWDDLEEAREIAERGSMNLWLVDYHLEASRLLISEFEFRNGAYTVGTDTPVETIHELSLRGETSPRHEISLQRADDHLKQAADLIQKTGYHRRDPEVELGYAGLFFAQGDHVNARERLGTAKAVLDKMGIRCWDFEVRRLERVVG